MNRKTQSGRSLLEIIAVMGIIGILTVLSVKTFQEGMNTVKAKYVMEQIQLRVDEAISITELSNGHKKQVYTPEYVNKTKAGSYGYAFTTQDISIDKTSLAYYLASSALKSTREVKISFTCCEEYSGSSCSKTCKISSNVCNKLKERIVISGDFNVAQANGTDILTQSCPEDISSMSFTVVRKPKDDE